MKILIQNYLTRCFLTPRGSWHRSAKRARIFYSSTAALLWVTENKLKDVQLVLRFDDPKQDIEMPLSPLPAPVVNENPAGNQPADGQ